MEFESIPINNKLYNCSNKMDIPFTCNGYGMTDVDVMQAASNVFRGRTCPWNWVESSQRWPKYGINGWLDDPTTPVTYNSKTNKLHQGAYYDHI